MVLKHFKCAYFEKPFQLHFVPKQRVYTADARATDPRKTKESKKVPGEMGNPVK